MTTDHNPLSIPLIPVDPACIAIPMDGRNGPALFFYVYEDDPFDTEALVRRATINAASMNEE